LISPKLELLNAQAEHLGDDHWRVRLVLQNSGWLPTYVSKRSLERKVVRGVIVDVVLPDGAVLLSGKTREDIGQLEGKAYKHTGISFWPDYHVTDDRAKIEWVVQGGRVIASDSLPGTSAPARYVSNSNSAGVHEMAKALGLGGLFFRSPDPEKLLAWYAQWLGIGDGKSSIEFQPSDMPRTDSRYSVRFLQTRTISRRPHASSCSIWWWTISTARLDKFIWVALVWSAKSKSTNTDGSAGSSTPMATGGIVAAAAPGRGGNA
jgi:hypothetical protein